MKTEMQMVSPAFSLYGINLLKLTLRTEYNIDIAMFKPDDQKARVDLFELPSFPESQCDPIFLVYMNDHFKHGFSIEKTEIRI